MEQSGLPWYISLLIICAIVGVWEFIERKCIARYEKKNAGKVSQEEILEFEREWESDLIIKRMKPCIDENSTADDLILFLKTYPGFILRTWYRQGGKKYSIVRHNRDVVIKVLRDEEDKNWDKELFKNAVVEYEDDRCTD